jgi:hypothetical protein
MENYHLHMANKLIDKHDLFHALTPAEQSRARRSMTELIIPTDLAKHFKIQADFDRAIGSYDGTKQDQKDLFLGIIVHACDIANSSLPFFHFKRWGLRIIQELDDMFWSEKALPDGDKFPPLPFLKHVSLKSFYASQVMFASSFCGPLLASMAKEWPELKFLHDNTMENIAEYKRLQEEMK